MPTIQLESVFGHCGVASPLPQAVHTPPPSPLPSTIVAACSQAPRSCRHSQLPSFIQHGLPDIPDPPLFAPSLALPTGPVVMTTTPSPLPHPIRQLKRLTSHPPHPPQARPPPYTHMDMADAMSVGILCAPHLLPPPLGWPGSFNFQHPTPTPLTTTAIPRPLHPARLSFVTRPPAKGVKPSLLPTHECV